MQRLQNIVFQLAHLVLVDASDAFAPGSKGLFRYNCAL